MKFASSGETHAIKELNSRESQRRQAFTPVIGGQNQRTGSQDSVQNMKPKLEEKPSELKVRDWMLFNCNNQELKGVDLNRQLSDLKNNLIDV